MSAEIIDFIEPPPPPPLVRVCSFCKRPEPAVTTLMDNGSKDQGGLRCICGDCARHAATRIKE